MKNFNDDYYVGFDIGTDSVGYAVADTDYNHCKFKGNAMWGVDLFEEALKNIASLDDKAAFASLVAQMHKEGSSPFFQLYVGADEKNSSMNIVNLYQGGMSMGDRDYYLSEDSANIKIRDAYKKYINKLFTLAGYSAEKAAVAEKNVMNIETALAMVAFSREETRNPLKNYNKK